MPIQHQWIIPKRLFYVRWSGSVTLEELQEANRNTAQFLETGEEPIHMLRDDSRITKFPSLTIRQILETMRAAQDPRLGWVVTVGRSNPMIHGLTDLYLRFTRIRQRRFQHLDEAIRFFAQADSSLDFSQISKDFERS